MADEDNASCWSDSGEEDPSDPLKIAVEAEAKLGTP